MTKLPQHERVVALQNLVMATQVLGCAETRPLAESRCTPNPLETALEQVEVLLEEHRQVEEIPGLAAGVVCGSELVWARGYGVMAVDDPRPVTPTTSFRIASITKVFTAMAVLTLQEAGALNTGDSVREHLPWFRIGRPTETGTAPVTIRHLLTRTAGMPRDSRLTDLNLAHYWHTSAKK